jgi:hypothetical protein
VNCLARNIFFTAPPMNLRRPLPNNPPRHIFQKRKRYAESHMARATAKARVIDLGARRRQLALWTMSATLFIALLLLIRP